MNTRNIFTYLLFLLLTEASCKRNVVTVQGKWKPIAVDNKYLKSFGLSTTEMKQLVDQSVIGFGKDGEFYSYETRDSVLGKYTYDEKQKKLRTIPEGKSAQIFDVEFIEPDEMILTNEFGKMTLKRL